MASQAMFLLGVPPVVDFVGALPDLWAGDEITADSVAAYFDGNKVVQVQREGFTEPMEIPKAPRNVVEAAVAAAVENGRLWLLEPTRGRRIEAPPPLRPVPAFPGQRCRS